MGSMVLEITPGFLMYWGGIVGAGLTVIIALIYFISISRKAKKMLKNIDKDMD